MDERSNAKGSSPFRPERTAGLTGARPGATFLAFRRGGFAIAVENPDSASTARSRVPRWLPPLIWAAIIIGASSLEDLQTVVGGVEIRDKLAHFGEYFVFGWLVARSFDGLGWGARKHFLWTLAFGLFLGVVDELYQGFVPGRERSALDVLADVVGSAAGWYFSREDQAVGDTHGTAGHS